MSDKDWCMSARHHKEGKKRTNLSFDIFFFKTHSLPLPSNINSFLSQQGRNETSNDTPPGLI
jgi:hypothetical protein